MKTTIFKSNPAFIKLFTLFKEKYYSLGRIGGNVSIQNFTKEEIETIASFLGVSVHALLHKGVVSLKEFEQQLAQSAFSMYTLRTLLEAVFEEELQTKKEQQRLKLQHEQQFIGKLEENISQAYWWLEKIIQKSSDSRFIWGYYEANQAKTYDAILTVVRAFSERPIEGSYERLPLFAQRITGNPHAFDADTMLGKMLLHCFFAFKCSKQQDSLFPKTAEERNDLLAEFGIIRDDLWNFVTCQGLLAMRGNTLHPVWEMAILVGAVLNMPMKELLKVSNVFPAHFPFVWIVENSSVASELMDTCPEAAIICTHGQLRMASWRLLDMLVKEECSLFYSGDLDPEGLLIAERLKKRYGNRLELWHMDVTSYRKGMSDEKITNRLSKLQSVTLSAFDDIKNLMLQHQKAAYQEAWIKDLIEDVQENSVYS